MGDTLEFGASDVTVKNLDSLVAPLVLLQPNRTSGLILDNKLTLAQGSDSTKVSLNALIAATGDPVLSFYNEIEFVVDLGGSELFAAVLAKLSAQSLFSFPLRDIMNLDCWLASLASPLNVVDGASPGLALDSILLSIPSLDFSIGCKNCTSPGFSVLPELLDMLESSGSMELLQERLVDLGLDLLRSDYAQAFINRLVLSGDLRCPHSSNYVDSTASSDYPLPNFPFLPYSALESLAFAAVTLLNTGIVVIAESHSGISEGQSTDPTSGQATVDAMGDVQLIDFLSLETSVGAWADTAVTELLAFLTDEVDDVNGPGGKDLRVNNLLGLRC